MREIAKVVLGTAAVWLAALAVRAREAIQPSVRLEESPKPSAPPAPGQGRPTVPPGRWERLELGETLELQPAVYAGVLQLEGFEATFGDASDVEAALRERMRWEHLEVNDLARVVPPGFLITRSPASGRYWAFGRLLAPATGLRPPQLRELWRFTPRATE